MRRLASGNAFFLTTLGASFLLLAVFLVVCKPVVLADPQAYSPLRGDPFAVGSTNDPFHVPGAPNPVTLAHIVSHADYNNVLRTIVTIYSTNPTIGVSIISADLCTGQDKIDNVEDVKNGGLDAVANGDTVTDYELTAADHASDVTGFGEKDDSCNTGLSVDQQEVNPNDTVGNEISNSSASIMLRAHANSVSQTVLYNGHDLPLYKFDLTALWDAPGQCANLSGSVSCGVNAFAVKALPVISSTDKYGHGDGTDGTMIWASQKSDGGVNATNFGLSGIANAPSISDPRYYDYQTRFGTDCSLADNATTNTSIQLYDDDNFNGPGAQDPNHPFYLRLQKKPKNGGSWSNVTFSSVNTVPAGNIAQKYSVDSNGNSDNNGNWLVVGTRSFDNNHNKVGPYTVKLSFTATGGYEYRFDVRDIDTDNNLQFWYPYETIWADASCKPGSSGGGGTVYVAPGVQPQGTEVEVTTPATFRTFAYVIGASGLPPGYGVELNCKTDVTGGNNPVVDQNVTVASDGPFCINDVQASSNTIGSTVCASMFPNGVTWTYGAGPVSGPPPGWSLSISPGSASGCMNVVGKSYFKVYGGDVATGGGVGSKSGESGQDCITNNNAGIKAWSHAADGGYAGAGSQLGVSATGIIDQLVSGQYNPFFSGNPTPRVNSPPRELTFANVGAAAGMSAYGGNFGAVPACTEYVDALPSSIASAPETGPVTIGATNLGVDANGNGLRITRYVKGDVYITGPIKYSNAGSYASLKAIPQFQLIVEGNIYIAPGVPQLDGLYVAIPTGGHAAPGGGNIYDCASPGNIPTATWRGCENQLVVNGSFVAGKVYLQRDCGSQVLSDELEKSVSSGGSDSQLCSAGNHAAEVFNYTPEQWIQNSGIMPTGYDAISNMPPVL